MEHTKQHDLEQIVARVGRLIEPIVDELSKIADSANKTAANMEALAGLMEDRGELGGKLRRRRSTAER